MTARASTGGTLEVLEERRDATSLWQRLRVPEDLACLEGHFPGFPVLPGLAQLAWLMEAGTALLGRPPTPVRIEALKFRELIGPGEPFEARADLAPGDSVLRFAARRAGRVAASCRLCLGSVDDGPAAPGLGVVATGAPAGAPDATSAARVPVAELLPHAGPMVFLAALLAGDEKHTVCRVRIDDLPLFRGADGALPGWAGIEPMAQCIAAHGGRDARRRGQAPRVGFLLGCRRLEIGTDRLRPGVDYAVSATQVWGGESGLVSFDCELYETAGGRRLLAGRLNAYLPEGLEGLSEGRLG